MPSQYQNYLKHIQHPQMAEMHFKNTPRMEGKY